MSAILNDPPFFGGIVNINIKANRDTPLDLGQGSGPSPPAPPSSAPVLELDQTAPTQIDLLFDTSTITGSQPIAYEVRYGEVEPLTNIALALEVSPNLYAVTVSGLTPATTYLFQSVATNADGSVEGAVVEFSTDPVIPEPPTMAPTLPTLIDAGRNTIAVGFDVAGIEGTQPITYSVNYGPTTALGNSEPATLFSGTVYNSVPGGLTALTDYYFASVATNADGSAVSAIAGPFKTLA